MRLHGSFCVLACLVLVACSSSHSGYKKHRHHPVSADMNQDPWDNLAPRDPRYQNEPQPAVSSMENACVLLSQRPHWAEALDATRIRWHIEPWQVLAFMHQESRFNPTAMSTSQAYGYAQVKQPTWEWYQMKRGRQNVSRERFDDAVDFIGWYANQNVIRNGVDLNDVRNQYLAYHEGLGGFETRSFLAKTWLMTISDKVADRAALYQAQLRDCPVGWSY